MNLEKRFPTSQQKLGPRLADLYALLMGLFGVLVLIRLLDYQTMSFDLLTLLSFTLLALLVSYFRIPIGQNDAELRIDGAILLGATLTAGPVIGGWAAFITGLVTGILPLPRKRLDRSSVMDHIVTASLNSGRNVVAIGAAWIAYYWLGGTLKPSRITLGLGLALILLGLSYVLVRSLLAWPVLLLKDISAQKTRIEVTNANKVLIELIPLPIALLISPAFIQFGWTRFLTLALVLIGTGALIRQMAEMIQSLQNQIGTVTLSNRIKQALSSTPHNTQALCDLARQFCAEIVPAQCEIGLYNKDMTQVTVQSGAKAPRAPLMRIPITPLWNWIGQQRAPILYDTPAQLDALELPLPKLESGEKPQSVLLAPILGELMEREKDWPGSAADTVPEKGRSQEDGLLPDSGPILDNTGKDPASQGDAGDGGSGHDFFEQAHHPVGALVLQSSFGNAFDKPVFERIQILTRLISEAMEHTQALSSHAVQGTDQRIARQIQADLLQQPPSSLEGWDIAVRWELSAQARDVYSSFFRLPNKDKFVIIEPHSHGFAAAMTGLLVHTLIRANDTEAAMSETEALEAMNAYLRATRQATALLCVTIDRENILTLINAGCASPLWWHSEHKHVEDLRSKGNALGLTHDATYEEESIALASNDVLVLCTNSLIDVSDGKESFGQQGLIRVLNQFAECDASELAAAIMDRISDFGVQKGNVLPSRLQEDILLAVFRRKGNGSDEPAGTEDQDDSTRQDATGSMGDANRL